MLSHKPLTLASSIVLFLLLLLLPATVLTLEEWILLTTTAQNLEDPNGRFNDWLPDTSPCNWTGIACTDGVITSIDLSSSAISGRFPYEFCQIATLRHLDLADNFLNGTLSSVDVAVCSRLRYLNLSLNDFVGKLPDFSPDFASLLQLGLSQNNISGEIPPSYGRLPELQVLNLAGNFISGKIPAFFGNLTELVELSLGANLLDPAPLPAEIGNMTKLERIWLADANLIGEIPESIGNLARLRSLDLTCNDLTGVIPESIGRLTSLEKLELYRNRLSGAIPQSLGNLTSLLYFDASQNALTGEVPDSFARIHLVSLGLNDNLLEGHIPEAIATNPNLTELKLFNNSFSGRIPGALGRKSELLYFDVSGNVFTGELPESLCNRGALVSLVAFNNRLSGRLPEMLGGCKSLWYVRIQNNSFSGEVPRGLWSLPELYHLELRDNMLQGSIPHSISVSWNLTQLLISNNNFSGVMPSDICNLSELSVLSAYNNEFYGDLPACISTLQKLQKIELQDNKLSGKIPVGSWPALTELNLSGNRFSGEIPSGLGNLPVLTYLDLSKNQLSGTIPSSLSDLKLNIFSLSGNDLVGEIPAPFDTAFYLPSFLGNTKLCSRSSSHLHFPPCSTRAERGLLLPYASKIVVLTTGVIFLGGLLIFATFLWAHYKKPNHGLLKKGQWKLTSFHRVGFDESEIFDCLKEENLIGSGGSGLVYRATLKTGRVVAVKKLWVGPCEPEAEREFRSEVETLGMARHANIVKLLFCCIAEEVKSRVLVYEYMENGSLGDVLHAGKGGMVLDWDTRVKVAIGAAQGLAYLHHDCVPPIVHRDVKPNNILLDREFNARVADFGLARILQRINASGDGGADDHERVMTQIAGSYGYIAPEYGYTLKVNEKSDVYSFGVVLLELVTGRKAVESEFGEGKDIVRWMLESIAQVEKRAEKGKGLDFWCMMDPRLRPTPFEYEEMVRVLDVGILCTSRLPMDRPSMRRVVELLKDRSTAASLRL